MPSSNGVTPSISEDQPEAVQEDRPSLVQNGIMVCPACEVPRRDFKRLDRVDKYSHELNIIYQCPRQRGGCGHVFSPGDNDILRAYLAGDLIPRALVVQKIKEIKEAANHE